MARWVHPDVLARAPRLSGAMLLAILGVDLAGSVVFHAGGGQAMRAVERATGGLVHHSLAHGVPWDLVLAAVVFGACRVRLRHLGIDRRELVRWVVTAAVAWSALQAVMLGAAALGLVPPLALAGTVAEALGALAAMFLRTGLVEETVFRGLVLAVLARRFGVGKGLVLQALAFAASHLPARLADSPDAFALLASLGQHAFWGLVKGVMYLGSGSLLTVAALHTVGNLPTPFAVTDGVFAALFALTYLGGMIYIRARRWPPDQNISAHQGAIGQENIRSARASAAGSPWIRPARASKDGETPPR